jgi:drug/metabolite transporter (DMT)-like permease
MSEFRNSPLFAYFALAFGILCIGFSAIFVKLADVPGPVSTFYRLFFAFVAIVPVWLFKGMKVPGVRDQILIFIGSIFFAIDFLLWNSAILITKAAMATLLANNAPVWVGLISLVVFRQRLPAKFWVGLLISMIGLNILIGIKAWQTMDFNVGDLMSLAASFFYALYILFTSDVRKRVDTVTFMTFSVFFMVVPLFFFNLFTHNVFWGFSAKTWGSLAAMGLISHFGGWLAINYALGHLKGPRVSVTLLAQALVTAVMGIIILGENLSLQQIIGGLVLLSGVYLVNRRKAS